MTTTLMTFEEVRAALKQRFPMLMVDTVISLEPGKSIRTTKNVTGNEIQFMGHFPEFAVMPGTLIVEAIGQSASILFSKTTGTGTQPGEFLVLGAINEMRFLAPVVPGNRLEIEINVLKFIEGFALVEAVATVDGTPVARGKLGFAKRGLQAQPTASTGSV
jgi:3-hydroxyacyl-[acyl-carrier-protein] dehydratase